MRFMRYIVSLCLPKDEPWVDELVVTAANDGLATLEECVDVSLDNEVVGEATASENSQSEEGFWGTPVGCAKRKCNKAYMCAWCFQKFSSMMKCPNTPNPSICKDIVVRQEYRNGSLDMFELLFAGRYMPTPTSSGSTNSSVEQAFVRKTTPVEVVSHRRVRRGKKMSFVQTLACEIKAKLGTPNRTSANVLTVRHLAYSRCREVNLRAVDTRHAVEQVIELVFANDQADVQAAKIRNSRAVKKQAALVAYQSKSALFRWLVSSETYASWAWSTSVGHADG